MRLSESAAKRVTRQRALAQFSFREAARRSGLSVGTWQRIEGGGEVEYRSLVKAVTALGWPADAADRLARDEDPDTPGPSGDAGTGSSTENEVGLAALAGELTPENRAKVEGYIKALLDGQND